MALWINEAEVATLLAMREAIDALRDVFRHLAAGAAVNEPRRRVRTSLGFLHMMGAADLTWNVAATKVYASFGGRTSFFVQLFDIPSSELLALIEADRLGRIRTGAMSALAAETLARPRISRLGVIGAGGQAETQLEALRLATDATEVTVFSRNEARCRAFAARMSEKLGIEIRPADRAEAAVSGHDLVVAITTSADPVLDGSWLDDGALVIAAGSNLISKRELDGATLARAARIYVDSREQAKIEAGDLAPAVDRGRLRWESLVEIGDVVAGRAAGRERPDEVLVFKSLGIAACDLAAARVVLERAREARVGRELPMSGRIATGG
jgi:ornithine cyclodeaminase/alanine dehydrogenase-like protein (mu-crystallin family)